MNIKTGDLVMIVKPTKCCGNITSIGRIFTVTSVTNKSTYCLYCGHTENKDHAIIDGRRAADILRLKKIDPPADGDSLPTRKELEVTA